MDKEEQTGSHHEDNAANKPTPDHPITCPACQGSGNVLSMKQLYINNTARFNCTCGQWITLTPFRDTVECVKCGEVWRWGVFSDSQLDQNLMYRMPPGIRRAMSPEQTEEVRNRLNDLIKELNDVSTGIVEIIATINS